MGQQRPMIEEETMMEQRKEAQHRGGQGNFAEDRERAAEAGRKGGEHSHGQERSPGQPGQSASGHDNRGSNFRDNPEKASEAGRKGGAHSHGGC